VSKLLELLLIQPNRPNLHKQISFTRRSRLFAQHAGRMLDPSLSNPSSNPPKLTLMQSRNHRWDLILQGRFNLGRLRTYGLWAHMKFSHTRRLSIAVALLLSYILWLAHSRHGNVKSVSQLATIITATIIGGSRVGQFNQFKFASLQLARKGKYILIVVT